MGYGLQYLGAVCCHNLHMYLLSMCVCLCVCVFFPLSASTLRTTINQRGNSGSLKAACSTLYVCLFVLSFCIVLYLRDTFVSLTRFSPCQSARKFGSHTQLPSQKSSSSSSSSSMSSEIYSQYILYCAGTCASLCATVHLADPLSGCLFHCGSLSLCLSCSVPLYLTQFAYLSHCTSVYPTEHFF